MLLEPLVSSRPLVPDNGSSTGTINANNLVKIISNIVLLLKYLGDLTVSNLQELVKGGWQVSKESF